MQASGKQAPITEQMIEQHSLTLLVINSIGRPGEVEQNIREKKSKLGSLPQLLDAGRGQACYNSKS